MKDKLNKFLGLEGSREQMPDGDAQRIKYLRLDRTMPAEKDREIWENILRGTSSAEKPVSSGFDRIAGLFRQRKMIFAGVSLVVLFCAGLFLLLITPRITGVSVAVLNGNVLVNGEPLTKETRLRDNDTLETPEEAKAKILIGKGNVVYLDSGTGINFRMNGKNFRIKMISGRIGAVLNNKKVFSECRIETPLAVVTAKGTSFFIDVSDKKKTYLCICNGSLEYFTKTDTQPKSFASGHHKALEFKLEGNKVIVSDGALKYHDDRYMDFIAGLINEKIPWGE